jgi:CheY-like chemotaxis protein
MGVLVVDDDQAIREMLAEFLADIGYAVTVAEHGGAALAALAAARPLPQVILLDLYMPVMNGWQFVPAVQRYKTFASIPIVLMSAGSNLTQVTQTPPVADTLAKPIDLNHLHEIVVRYCGPLDLDDTRRDDS